MFDLNKSGYNLSFTSTVEESVSETSRLIVPSRESKNRNRNAAHEVSFPSTSVLSFFPRSEHRFPTIDETMVSSLTEVSMSATIQQAEETKNPYFKKSLFEECLKATAIFYLSVGIVASIVHVSRHISPERSLSNESWSWIGWLNVLLALSIVLFAVWYKILFHNNPQFIEYVRSDNSVFFYTCVVLPSAGPWMRYLLLELRNLAYSGPCLLVLDKTIPIVQMLSILTVLMTTSDLIHCRLKLDSPRRLYLAYKTAATLVLTYSITSLIFNIFDIESQELQRQLINDTNAICLNTNIFGGLYDTFGRLIYFLQMIETIFFLSIIITFIQPIQQISFPGDNPPDEPLTLSKIEANHEYNSTSLILACIFFIASIIVIPLDYMGMIDPDQQYPSQIVFCVLPFCIYIVIFLFSLHLLKLIHTHFANRNEVSISKVDFYIIWISLLGMIVSCLQKIINSSQFLCTNGEGQMKYTVHILNILLWVGVIFQSMLQAVVLSVINKLNRQCNLSKKVFEVISYPLVILIASNFGFFLIDWYLSTNYSSFKSFPGTFNEVIWDFLAAVSSPFTLLFRGHCILFLFQYMTSLRCRKNPSI